MSVSGPGGLDEPASGWAGRVAAMAVIAAVGVSMIYVPQPIQTLAAAEFGVPLDQSAAPTVAVQAGYAMGVVLLVSLGDRLVARRQVAVQLAITAAAILVAAASASFLLFSAMMFVAGATATVGQILVAAALRLAPPQLRARTAAVLLGAFLVGLFGVRTALGAFGDALGWRTVLVGAAVLVLACIPVTIRFAPRTPPPGTLSYGQILATLPRVAAGSVTLRRLTAAHALAFSAFICIWSMITLHGVADLGLSVAQTAALGLAGLLGGATTMATARVHAVIGPRRALAISLTLLVAGCLLIAVLPSVLPALVAGLFLVSFGMASSQVSTQSGALASIEPAQSGRGNTIFMGATFLAGASTTALAGVLMAAGGYGAVGALAVALALGSSSVATVHMRQRT